MTRLVTTAIVLALAGAAALSACTDRSTYDERYGTLRAGQAAPTFNCQDRGTCGGPTAIPGTTDSSNTRAGGRQ